MVVRTVRSRRAFVWIPPTNSAEYKLTVERADGTVDDITEEILSLNIENTATEGVGTFEFEVPNPSETYTAAWTGMEIVRFYSDYAADATTLRFRGRIERPSKAGNNLKVTGRSESLFVMDQTVTKQYDATDTADILTDLFNTYGQSRYSLASIPASTGTSLTVNWVEKSFWEAVVDLCVASEYDCYIDADLVVQFFPVGSVSNTTEGIVHEFNLFSTEDSTPDLQYVKNKIRVFGAEVDGVQAFYTANDTTSQSSYGVRKTTVQDDNITTGTQAKEYADYLLAEYKDPPVVVVCVGTLLPSVNPGEKIYVSDPMNGLDPGLYRVISYKHEVGDSWKTTVQLNKEVRKISHIIRDRVEQENKQQDTSSNASDLDFNYSDGFSTDTGTHSNTEIVDGFIQVINENLGVGTWTSTTQTSLTGNNITTVHVDAFGDNIVNASFEVSANNGASYQSIPRRTKTTLTSTFGTQLILRITLNNETVRVDSASVQYSTE